MRSLADQKDKRASADMADRFDAGKWFDGKCIRPSIYTDPALFDLEMERVFGAGWVYLGHVSELPQPGSYKSTWIGKEPVILVRNASGDLRVLRNRCRHRGATVCQEERGQARHFSCAYHGWTYDLDGRLVAMPEPDGYRGVVSAAELPLLPAATVDDYRGLIFASLNADVAPLREYLKPALPYMDEFLDQGAPWELAVAGQFKLLARANWKLILENSTDGYHFQYTHRSYLNLVDTEQGERHRVAKGTSVRFVRALGNGHGVIHGPRSSSNEARRPRIAPREWDRFVEQAHRDHPEQADRMIASSVGSFMNVCLFPNVSLSDLFLRELRPIAVDLTEVRHTVFKLVGAPDIANEIRLRIHESFNGPGGLGNTDDVEAWRRVQEGVQAAPDQWVLLNRGLMRESDDGEGGRVSDGSDETAMRGAYTEWARLMSAGGASR